MTTPDPDGPPARGRFTSKVLAGGREPDPRFTLANERTFLAWIRTSLALTAGGIAVEAFTGSVFDPLTRMVLGSVLLGLAGLLAVTAGFRWIRVERAMRHGRPLPLPLVVPVLATGGAVAAGVLLVFLLLRQV
ncbi:YidH family protein [Citricoccus nitrophenolicus]|uniref:YidH family protein n=1 Tax=Citricoccus nitrophenolicus TaxID=863575 RepID=UPI0031E92D68